MTNKNIQMKKREGNDWDNLFPLTLAENVYSKVGVSVESDIERIDDSLETATVNLGIMEEDISQRGVDIKKFGVTGDGIVDDTVPIQNALDSGLPIYWSSGTYLFDNVVIHHDDTKINFGENVILNSNYSEDALANDGGILISGEVVEHKNILTNINENDYSVSLNTTSNLNVGDLIQITQTNPTGSTFEISKQKYITTLSTIKEFNGNTVILNDPIPFSYQLSNNPILSKIEPVKNVELNGNHTLFDKMGTSDYTNHFSISHVKDLKIGGFNTVNGGGKGIVVNSSYNVEIYDWEHSKTTNISAGHGYGMQIGAGSRKVYVHHASVYDSRHAIDISSSANDVFVERFNGYSSDFSGHGMNSKNVTFENCHAFNTYFEIGNNTFQTDSHYTFNNCHVYNAALGFSITRGSYDVRVLNCTTTNVNVPVTMVGGAKNITVDGLKADGIADNGIQMNDNTENVDISNSSFILNNKTGATCRGIWTRANVKDVSISNVKISTADDMVTSNYTRGLMVEGSSNITLENVEISGKLYDGVLVADGSGELSFNHLTVKNDGNRTFNVRGSEIILTNNRISGANMLISPSVLLMTSNIFNHTGTEVYPDSSNTVVTANNIFI